jgi:hypothetical protein
MDDDELAELDQGIRALLAESGLDWVRENIEEGVVAGGRKEVLVQHDRANEPEALFGVGEFQYVEPTAGKKGQRMIGNVPLSPTARVKLTIQALRRLIIELPEIQEDAVKRLAESEDHDSAAEDVRFLPDEDDASRPVLGLEAVNSPSKRDARHAADSFLSRLLDEVMS